MTRTPDTFSTRLRALRAEAGISQGTLAERAGVSRQHVLRLERGDQQPSLEVARKLAVALGRGLDCWG